MDPGASYLLGQPPCEEGVQVLGIQPHEALEVLPPDIVGFIFLLSEFRQVLRLNGVALDKEPDTISWHLPKGPHCQALVPVSPTLTVKCRVTVGTKNLLGTWAHLVQLSQKLWLHGGQGREGEENKGSKWSGRLEVRT
jgi:hypothetical protein